MNRPYPKSVADLVADLEQVQAQRAHERQARSDDEQAKPVLLRPEQTRDELRGRASLANVLFVVGGLAAVGSGVLAFTTDWGPRLEPTASGRTSLRANLAAGSGNVSVGATGSF